MRMLPGWIKKQEIRAACFVGLVVLLCLSPFDAMALNGQTGSAEVGTGGVQQTREQVKLWNRAIGFLGDGNKVEAAPLFKLFYERYPDSGKAEEALWHAARLHKHLVLTGRESDWDRIKDLYREFTVAFPESELLPMAYLEVGKAYMAMGYFREAVPYFGIIIRSFPDRDIVEEASILKSRALYRTGRVEEAVSIYRELGRAVDENYGRLADGYEYYGAKRYHDALGSFLKILKRDPTFYLKEPDILRIMGDAYLRTGQTEQGRRRLEHYLNLHSGSHREEVLFRIGESYLEEGKSGFASRFYERALKASERGDRIHSFSRYRLAVLEEERKKAKPGEEIDPKEFVQVREAVLEQGSSGELIQEARLELIRYYWDSQEVDKVYDLGRIYLNYESGEQGGKQVEQMVCRLLDERLSEMLDQEKYKNVYQLYKDDYSYIKRCERASVRVKVGRALEHLALYDKAAVVYWRAMNLEMTPAEKKDLYIYRAENYLAGKAYKSADTLLGHLRWKYKDDPIIADVHYLSGRLAETRDREEAALDYYGKAATMSFHYEEKKPLFAKRYLNLLLKHEKIERLSEVLEKFRKEDWLENGKLQRWYVLLGDNYRKQNEPGKAGAAYRTALSDEMPEDNEMVQKANLYYGDVQLSLGNVDKAVELHNRALNGPNQLYTKIARQRLEEDEMTRSLPEMGDR